MPWKGLSLSSFQEVPRARQEDNKLLVQKTLNFLGAAGNTKHFFARNGIAQSMQGALVARLYSVLVRISKSGKSFLKLRQSTREQALSELGSKKVGRGLDTPLPHCQPRSTLPRRSTEAFFVQSFPCTLLVQRRAAREHLWNMFKKTIIALAVLDTKQRTPLDPVNAEIRVIKSVFCKD